MHKKILLIASYAPSLIVFRYHLIKAWLDDGYEVIAAAPIEDDPDIAATVGTLAKINVTFIPIPLQRTSLNPFADVKTMFILYKLIRSQQITHIFSYTMKPTVYGSLAAKMAGASNIYSMVTGTGYIFSATGFRATLVRTVTILLLRSAMKYNSRIFFQNKDNLNDFKNFGIIHDNTNTTLINGSGVNIQEYQPTAYPKQIVFLLIARLLISKGIREYAAAALKIKKRFPEIRFLLVGWLDKNPHSIAMNELQSWVDSSLIEYRGRLKDVRPAITEASVFVLPSYGEGTPRSVLEAMAMSRPIITTDVPGCRETVIPGKNGFLVPKQDHLALATAMQNFIEKPELITTMGAISRQIAVEKYDVHKVNQIIINAMEGNDIRCDRH